MSLLVKKAGLQTSIQGAPFAGHRHIGMPAAGAADSLSLALANILVGKKTDAAALEITLNEAQFIAEKPCFIAVSGAANAVEINAIPKQLNAPLRVKSGDIIRVAPATKGCRSYLAINQPFVAERVLDSDSTYMPAGLGGFQGRSLQNGDVLQWRAKNIKTPPEICNIEKYVPLHSGNFILRITAGPEADTLEQTALAGLSSQKFAVGSRANRMGMELNGYAVQIKPAQDMLSAPVFPGTIQCPPNGQPFLLGPDAQTTGGYPRIAQVIKADRHLIGQLRPGSHVQFVPVSPEEGAQIYREKRALLKPLFGEINLW